MPESSVGRVLQRGGEELLVDKSADRFTVNPQDPALLEALVQELPTQPIAPAGQRAEILEFEVEPTQRDAVMAQFRASSGVRYASHVYQLQNTPGSQVYLTDQLTVQFSPEMSPRAIAQLAETFGLQQVKAVPGMAQTFVFEVTPAAHENPLKIANRLAQRPDVLAAEPNVMIRSQSFYRPREPLYPQQWHLHHNGGLQLATGSHVFAEGAWAMTRGERSVVVAIADDSVDINHPDFQGPGKIVAPRDFFDNDFLPLPGLSTDNHGTACAGVAVAEENGTGAIGVAPGCALMPLRTTGFLDDDSIEALFGWAMEQGADVISCSWGPSAVYFPLSLRQRHALQRAATEGRHGKGCVILFAAGNANRPTNGTVNEQGWPRNFLQGTTHWLGGFNAHPDVITVSASTSLNQKAAYSNWGAEISVCAPSNNAPPGVGLQELGYVATPPPVRTGLEGLGIVTTDRPDREGYSSADFTWDFGGTSSACPLVAGVAALVLSVNPDLTAREVRQVLEQSADKIVDPRPDPQFGFRKGTYEVGGRCDWFGYGKVNAQRAVQLAKQRQMAAIAPTRKVQQQNLNPIQIPDHDLRGITSLITIDDSALVRDIQVRVVIAHPFLGDLEIRLISPQKQNILLQGRTLGRKQNLQTTYNVQTTPLLRRLLNQPANGNWELWLIDHALGDVGTLRAWELALGV